MRRILGTLLFSLTALLSAQFNNPVQVNQNAGDVFYRGSDACKIIGNEIYMTFVEDSLAANLWFSRSEDGLSFAATLIDNGIFIGQQALPSLEILPSGKIIVFYVKAVDEVYTLHKAVSIDSGATFVIAEIESEVTEFASARNNNELILSYKKHNFANLSYLQHFSQTEETENSSQQPSYAKFMGWDMLEGPVHSNDDIRILQGGGGNNNGWPTFHGKVTTARRILDAATGLPLAGIAPMAQIFLGGWEEETGEISYNSTIAQSGILLGSGADIVVIRLFGSSAEIMLGHINYLGTQDFNVYSWHPMNAAQANDIINAGGNWFEDSDQIWTNQVAIYDTVWTSGGNISWENEACFWIPDGELWIEGVVQGAVTFGCANNVYITDDISYSNTPLGMPPDDNPTDYFGLFSQEKIIIRYKHRDPFDPNYPVVAPNCSDVYLYGAYAALGEGDSLQYGNMACHYDGMLTFEYQHPHGSTPDFTALSPYTLQDTVYTYIDLHKYIFPIDLTLPPNIIGFNLHGNNPVGPYQTCGYPYESSEYLNSYPNANPQNYVYPYGTDYPWYNPVWPESSEDFVFERGILHIWGSVAQTRRGFIHRSGLDPYNHPPGNNEWDLDNFHFDGTHSSTGYAKDYHYDSRFSQMLPKFFISAGGGELHSAIIAKSADEGNSFEQLAGKVLTGSENICYLRSSADLIALVTMKNQNLKIDYSVNGGLHFSNCDLFSLDGILEAVALSDNKVYLLFKEDTAAPNTVYEFNPTTVEFSIYQQFSPSEIISDFAVAGDESRVYAYLSNYTAGSSEFEFLYTDGASANFSNQYNWQTSFTFDELETSRLSLNFDYQNYVYVSLLNSFDDEITYGELWLAKGSLPNLTGSQEIEIPHNSALISHFSNYPNPFNPSTTISFSLTTEITEDTEIVIYNLKGQKIKTLDCSNSFAANARDSRSWKNARDSRSTYSVIWDGTDDHDKPVSSGVYFYKLKTGDYENTRKCLLMK